MCRSMSLELSDRAVILAGPWAGGSTALELGSPGCDVARPLPRARPGCCLSPEEWGRGQAPRVLRLWEGRGPGHSGLHPFGAGAPES